MKNKLFFILCVLLCGLSTITMADNTILPSFCDEWNVLHEPFSSFAPPTVNKYRLTTDTVINSQTYVKLERQESEYYKSYCGSLREGDNSHIYYIPTNSTQEYLIYAFNAQVGDELKNVWLGGDREIEDCVNAHNAIVVETKGGSPRLFTLEIIPNTSDEEEDVSPFYLEWIESVGMIDGPIGSFNSNKLCISAADVGTDTLLCAYSKGEHIYTSPKGEQYGCGYQAIETISDLSDDMQVVLHDGKIFILRGDKTYTLIGQEVR